MKKKYPIILLVLFFVIAYCFSIFSDIKEVNYSVTISEVKNGNTIILSSGLTVHLNGIKRKNAYTEELLKNYIGQEVALELDSSDEGTTLTYHKGEEVNCYVQLLKTGEDLSALLIKSGGVKAFDRTHCHDRRKEYENMIGPCIPPPPSPELLCACMTASTMLVFAGDQKRVWNGTAFFVGEDGLAITNYHVLNHQTHGVVFLSDSQGNVDTQQPFNIKRIVYTNEDYDYTIFYVDLDPTTQQRLIYLKIGNDRNDNFLRGTEIAAVGAPNPGTKNLTLPFAMGKISAIRDDIGKIQIDTPISHVLGGGPVANRRGQVVGISQSGYEHNDASLNYAVDIRIVRAKLDELKLPYAGK